MNSNVDKQPSWRLRFMPKSIVARTTLSILALSLLVGSLFALAASFRAQRTEENRLHVQVEELLSTVEATASIACFLRDDTLAKEIAQGLLKNHAVAGVRIVAGERTLYETTQAGTDGMRADIEVISRKIYSPFVIGDSVGEIALYTSRAQIRSQAQRYSLGTALVLGLQVAFVAAGVALVVFLLVTRPIRGISNELHRLELSTGMQLQVPRGNHADEIGRLVDDVNALIANLISLLTTERELRIEHEVQERKMRLILDKAETAIFVLDTQGAVHSWNPAFARILNITVASDSATPPRLHELLAPHGPEIDNLIQQALETGEPCNLDLEMPHGASQSAWLQLSINPIVPGQLQGIINDITVRKHSELSAERAATHDALTGLLNRYGVNRSLADLFSLTRGRQLRDVALLQIDLDYFKQVNDTYGHEAGDRVLSHVARALEGSVRRSDLVSRPGGDEFIAILIGVESAAKAQSIADGMIAKISQPIDIGAGKFAHVSASIGIAFPADNETPEAALCRADAAMYAAKLAGRSRAYIAATPSDSAALAAS